MKDTVFSEPIKKQFEFDKSVASVFDDMVSRSVPYYKEAQALAIELLNLRLSQGAKVADLGCSTGEFLLSLWTKRKDLELLAYDNSEAMLEIAKNKTLAYGANISFFNQDILTFNEEEMEAIILTYTLQFIRPIEREKFLERLFSKMKKGGILILSEKLIYEDKVLNKQMIELYLAYKKQQGYSKFEISQKRQALENVLIPYTEEENKKLIMNAGFASFDSLFKWGNFATYFAIK